MYKYIIYYFGIEIPQGLEPIAEYAFNIGLISLSVFCCFINVFGYLFSITLMKHYNLETKYPKLKNFFKRFEKTSLFFLVVEVVIGFGALLTLIFLGFYPLFA